MIPAVQGTLVTQKICLEEIADLADKILDTFDTRSTIAALTKRPEIANLNKRLESIEQTDERLESAMNALSFRRSRTTSRKPRSKSGAREREASQTGLCFYHARFQENAHKCVAPWKAGNA